MKIITEEINKKIKKYITNNIQKKDFENTEQYICTIYKELYNSIPEKKRISYGNQSLVIDMSKIIYIQLIVLNIPVFDISAKLISQSDNRIVKGIFLSIISIYGLENYKKVLPYFEECAASEDWILREYTVAAIKKILKKYPGELKPFILKLQKSSNNLIRRFVGETMRPVKENRWMLKNPGYYFDIMENMFTESNPYARTPVGNALSDFGKTLPDLVFEIIEKLVKSGNKNSYWIAYRGCRNLVKKYPIKVMNLLKVDEYKYKKILYKREDY